MHEKGAGLVNSFQQNQQTSALQLVQQRFAIIDLGGDIRVVDRDQIADVLAGVHSGAVSFYKKVDGDLQLRRHLESSAIPCNPKQVVADFWISPGTVEYKSTAFTPLKTPSNTLNFWVGPTTKSAPGNWVLLRDYLRDVICNGDSKTFDYLIGFMAHMLQKPEDKPGIMVVLLGGQGTGKGVYFKLLKAIWPRTTVTISDVDQVLGKFNAVLERTFIVCMDEALFAGDKRAIDKLKSTVTEPCLQIEQKYQPTRTIESVHRFFAASNHDHFANVERDDRRFVFLRVSTNHQQDTTYFGVIAKCIEDPVTLGALIYYLKRKDLTRFNVRVKPKTNEHLTQKLRSLHGFDRYWYEVLSTGEFSGKGLSCDLWSTSIFLPTSNLLDAYREFNKNAERHSTIQEGQVAESIRRMCPSAQRNRKLVNKYGRSDMKRGYDLPDLKKARDEFSKFIGGSPEWDDDA